MRKVIVFLIIIVIVGLFTLELYYGFAGNEPLIKLGEKTVEEDGFTSEVIVGLVFSRYKSHPTPEDAHEVGIGLVIYKNMLFDKIEIWQLTAQ